MSARKTAAMIRDEAKAKLEAKLYELALKRVVAKYDATDSNNDKKRRSPSPETQSEEQIFRPYERGKGIALCRDLERNFTGAKSIVRQLKTNVVGPKGGKVRLNTDDADVNQTAAAWFNGTWCKDCDARDDLHFSEFLKLALSTTIREGDCLAVFDDFSPRADGKLLFFEPDQMPSIDETDWKLQTQYVEEVVQGRKRIKIPMRQESGVIYDSMGKVHAYIASSKRGCQSVKMSEATILPKGSAKLLKMPWRFNQLRGTPEMITASSDFQDNYEMRSKELQSAKVAASFAGVVKKEKGGIEDVAMRAGLNPEDILGGSTAASVPQGNYENLESLTGGYIEYLKNNDDFKILDFNRPSIALKDFFEFVQLSGGASFGLTKTYTTLATDSAYTAFRGDMLLAWATFYDWQKWLERHLCDWVAVKALKWAMRKKLLPTLPQGWEAAISWSWPVMPQVDPEKEGNALNNEIKNGRLSLSDAIGPDWQERIDAAADQLAYAKGKGLPLSAFETRAGAPASSGNSNSTNTETVK